MIEATDFRDAMSLLTSAVSVVTTAGMADRHGFTASAVCSVTGYTTDIIGLYE